MKYYLFVNEKTGGWYIEQYTSIEHAEANCPAGYTVDLYNSTNQLYTF